MEESTTQESLVLNYIRNHGSITRYDAMNKLGVANLTAIIHTLRKHGVAICTTDVHAVNRYGRSITYAKYSLEEIDYGEYE